MIAIPPPQQIDEENASFFPASDALARRQRGQKFLALCFSPLPLVVAALCGGFLINWAFSIERPAEFLLLFAVAAIAGLAVFGTAFPIWRIWRNARRIETALPVYQPRALVVTPDYLEVFTGALYENECDYYIGRMTMVVRLSWQVIDSFRVREQRYKNERTRVYTIDSESLPRSVNGEIRILTAPFEEQEEALVAAIAQYIKTPVCYEI